MSGRDAAKPTSERLLCSHHGDFAIMSRLPACPICADALVARITDLEAQVENARVLIDVEWPAQMEAAEAQAEEWRQRYVATENQWQKDWARAEAAEAQVTALTLRNHELVLMCAEKGHAKEAVEAALAEMDADRARVIRDLHRTRDLLRDERDALATTRQALTQIEYLANVEPINPMIAHHARRALADTGGDTKEPA